MNHRHAVRAAVVAAIVVLVGSAAPGVVAARPRALSPSEAVVVGIYRTIFGEGRTVDAGGLAYWSGRIDAGVAASAVADRIGHSTEANRQQVAEDYEAYLGRGVDPTGIGTYGGLLDSGQTAGYVTNRLVASPEAFAASGSTASGYVSYLYDVLLTHAANPPGSTHWTAQLTDPSSSLQRKGVARKIASSGEARRRAVLTAYERGCGEGTPSAEVVNLLLGVWKATGESSVRTAAVAFTSVCPT